MSLRNAAARIPAALGHWLGAPLGGVAFAQTHQWVSQGSNWGPWSTVFSLVEGLQGCSVAAIEASSCTYQAVRRPRKSMARIFPAREQRLKIATLFSHPWNTCTFTCQHRPCGSILELSV